MTNFKTLCVNYNGEMVKTKNSKEDWLKKKSK